jgi:hypothetical protein
MGGADSASGHPLAARVRVAGFHLGDGVAHVGFAAESCAVARWPGNVWRSRLESPHKIITHETCRSLIGRWTDLVEDRRPRMDGWRTQRPVFPRRRSGRADALRRGAAVRRIAAGGHGPAPPAPGAGDARRRAAQVRDHHSRAPARRARQRIGGWSCVGGRHRRQHASSAPRAPPARSRNPPARARYNLCPLHGVAAGLAGDASAEWPACRGQGCRREIVTSCLGAHPYDHHIAPRTAAGDAHMRFAGRGADGPARARRRAAALQARREPPREPRGLRRRPDDECRGPPRPHRRAAWRGRHGAVGPAASPCSCS